ncbi:MAG TPA: hypothetical protein VK196_22265, partial [Magnetospirillum sp.]|nr:hypothetical protein [Magnetospirillum sp.]
SEPFSAGALEAKLREAAGWQNEPHPGLFVTGPIETLIANGASLDLDVLPVVRGRAPGVRRPSGWNFFVGPIQDAIEARRKAGTGPPLKVVNGSKPEPKQTLEQIIEETGWKPGPAYYRNSQ